MRRLTAILYLTITVLLGSAGCQTTDYQKGLDAYKRGDYATALRELKPTAELGDADAQYNLGVMYAEGKGVPQDHKTAVKWYRLAAEQGHATAQNDLSVMYEKGLGVPQNHTTAVKWLRLAAEQGYHLAQYNMGATYANGEGVPKDYKTALKWWRLAAQQGNAAAQTYLGWAYQNGHGVPQDDKTAVKWYRLAAEQGYVGAQERLAPLEIKLKAARRQEETGRLKTTCTGFGFKDGTKEMSNCMFELYKQEKSSSSKTQTVIQNNTGDNSAVRALVEEQRKHRVLLEEQQKQRQLEGSLEMMKRGLELMKPPPPRPQITCRYISHSKTTVCN